MVFLFYRKKKFLNKHIFHELSVTVICVQNIPENLRKTRDIWGEGGPSKNHDMSRRGEGGGQKVA